MRQVENECVNCDLPCIGLGCPYANVVHYYCDNCQEEETLYYFDGQELCIHCIETMLEKVED